MVNSWCNVYFCARQSMIYNTNVIKYTCFIWQWCKKYFCWSCSCMTWNTVAAWGRFPIWPPRELTYPRGTLLSLGIDQGIKKRATGSQRVLLHWHRVRGKARRKKQTGAPFKRWAGERGCSDNIELQWINRISSCLSQSVRERAARRAHFRLKPVWIGSGAVERRVGPINQWRDWSYVCRARLELLRLPGAVSLLAPFISSLTRLMKTSHECPQHGAGQICASNIHILKQDYYLHSPSRLKLSVSVV